MFNYQLHILDEISDSLLGRGKAVDDNDPISPVQKPRGYGGVGILWSKRIDHLVTPIPDGSTRIQCVILKRKSVNLLLISVYMPCKGQHDNFLDFCECVDQLAEIVTKYLDHDILIGGDFNEDISVTQRSRRLKYLQEFVAEYKMNIASSSKTFVHANGKDCSNIDYFMFRKSPTLSLHDITCLNTIGGNTSDHFPVRCEINSMLESLEDTQRDDDADSDRSVCISRINWSKVDKQQYLSTVEDKLGDLTLHISNKQALEQSIISVQTVMRDAATASGGISSRRKPRYLRSVTPVVKE